MGTRGGYLDSTNDLGERALETLLGFFEGPDGNLRKVKSQPRKQRERGSGEETYAGSSTGRRDLFRSCNDDPPTTVAAQDVSTSDRTREGERVKETHMLAY